MKKYNLAIVGATGLVGRTIINQLEGLDFPIGDLYLLASEKSAGTEIEFRSQCMLVKDLATFAPEGIDIAFFSAGSDTSKKYAPIFADTGCIVIDNTSYFRYEEDIPLIVPEINPDAIKMAKNRNIIANPNCSTIQMLMAIAPIHRQYNITNVQVATYQSVSGAGTHLIDTMMEETALLIKGEDHHKSSSSKLKAPIAFNVYPSIDVPRDDASTKEEWKMHVETKKILDEKIDVFATCVRVPVVLGHSEAIFLETEGEIGDDVYGLYDGVGGVVVDRDSFTTPAEIGGTNDVYISRIRKLGANRLALWCVSDNLRRGASWNAIQIAMLLKSSGMI